jgi:hypothetical protein
MKEITYKNGFTRIVYTTKAEMNEFYRKTANVVAFTRPGSLAEPEPPETEEQKPEEPPQT